MREWPDPDPRTRPFRFGVGTAAGTPHARRHWTEHVRRIEDLGFATLQVADHYLNPTVCTPRLTSVSAPAGPRRSTTSPASRSGRRYEDAFAPVVARLSGT